MLKLAIGFILGIIVGTVGVSGVLNVAQKGIDTVKTHSMELSK